MNDVLLGLSFGHSALDARLVVVSILLRVTTVHRRALFARRLAPPDETAQTALAAACHQPVTTRKIVGWMASGAVGGARRLPGAAGVLGKLAPGSDPAPLEVLQVSGALGKRAADVATVLAITWGTCFLMTVPFGLSDLGFSLIFATALTAVILLVVGVGILFKRGWDALKRR